MTQRLSVVVGGFLILPCAALPAGAQGPAAATAFVNVSVIPMDKERVLPDQTVIVRGDRIVALGPTGRISVPPGATVLNGRGKFLLPGLADMHVHFGKLGDRGWELATTTDVSALLFTYVANGVTTVRDMHSGSPLVDPWMPTLRRRIAQGELVGPRLYATGDPDKSSAEAAAKSIEAMKAAGYDFVKLYGSARPTYDWVTEPAHRVGLPIVGHASHGSAVDYKEFPGVPGAFRDHWASLEHLIGYFQYATGVSYNSGWRTRPLPQVADSTLRRIARETARAGVWNCPTLAIIWHHVPHMGGAAADSSWRWEADFYQRLVRALQAEGAGLLLGTDGGTREPLLLGGFGIHRELELLVEAGLTPYQALATGTRNVAQFLGTLDSTGTVAVGKRADLVLLKANPLVDIHQTTALAGVMIGGRWLPRDELDQRIDSLRSVPDTTAKPGDSETWGPLDAQARLLRRVIWR